MLEEEEAAGASFSEEDVDAMSAAELAAALRGAQARAQATRREMAREMKLRAAELQQEYGAREAALEGMLRELTSTMQAEVGRSGRQLWLVEGRRGPA